MSKELGFSPEGLVESVGLLGEEIKRIFTRLTEVSSGAPPISSPEDLSKKSVLITEFSSRIS